jgi:hypothetical protein
MQAMPSAILMSKFSRKTNHAIRPDWSTT